MDESLSNAKNETLKVVKNLEEKLDEIPELVGIFRRSRMEINGVQPITKEDVQSLLAKSISSLKANIESRINGKKKILFILLYFASIVIIKIS